MPTAAQLNAQRKKAGITTTVVAKPTVTAVKKNAAAQNANAATRGSRNGMNANAQIVQRLVTQNFTPAMQNDPKLAKKQDVGMALADGSQYVKAPARGSTDSPLTNPIASPSSDPGNIEKLRTLRQSGFEGGVDANGNVVAKGGGTYADGSAAPVATPEQIQKNAMNLKGIMDQMSPTERSTASRLQQQIDELNKPLPDGYMSGDSTLTDPVLRAQRETERENQKAALQQQLTEIHNRNSQKKKDALAAAAGVAPVTDPTTGATTTPGASTPTTPAVPGATPVTDGEQQITDAKKTAQDMLDDRLTNINAIDPNALDKTEADAIAKDNYKSQLDAATEQEKIDREKALEKERNALAINDRAQQLADIENTKSQLDQIKLNTVEEVKNRRKLNKLTGSDDMSGLDWVQKQTQDGLDQLNYLRSKAANMYGTFADKSISIINDYGNDLAQAEATKKTAYAGFYDKYLTRLDDVRKELKLDETDKRKERDAAHKDYGETLIHADFKYGDWLQQLQLKAIDRTTGLEKLQIQTQQQQVGHAIQMLSLSTKKGVIFSPAAMAAFEKQISPDLPAGWLTRVASGGTGSGNVDQNSLAAINAWVLNNPGKNITNLTAGDIKLITQIYMNDKGPAPTNTTTWVGRGSDGSVPAITPYVPTAFGQTPQQKETSKHSDYKFYIQSAGINEKDYTYAQYTKDFSFNGMGGDAPINAQGSTGNATQDEVKRLKKELADQQSDPADEIIDQESAKNYYGE